MGPITEHSEHGNEQGLSAPDSAAPSVTSTSSFCAGFDNTELNSMYAQIVEASVDAVYSYDLGGRILTWNASAAKLFGYSSAEIIGQNVALLFPADRAVDQRVTAAFDGAPLQKYDAEKLRKDGSRVAVQLNVSTIKDRANNVTALAVIARIITEQMRRQRTVGFLAELQASFPDGKIAVAMQVLGERIANYLGVERCIFIEYSQQGTIATAIADHFPAGQRSLVGTHQSDQFNTPHELGELATGQPVSINDVQNARTIESVANFAGLGIRALVVAPCIQSDVLKFAILVSVDCPRQWLREEVEFLTILAERIYLRLDRDLAEDQLREREHFLQRLTDTSPSMIVVFDLETERPVFVNRAIATVLDYSAEEFIAMGPDAVALVIHPEDLSRKSAHLNYVCSLGDDETADGELRLRGRSGDWRWFLTKYAVFSRDAEGAVTQLIATAIEITAAKDAEERLRASENFARTVLEASPDCVKVLGVDDRLEYVNQNGMCLLEVDNAVSVVGKPWEMLWPETVRPRLRAAIMGAKAGELVNFVAEGPTEKGTHKYWDVSVSPILGADGQPDRLLATSRDVTAKVEADAALRESDRRLAAALHAGDLGVFDHDLLTGQIIWDDKLRQIWGVSADERINMQTFYAGVHPDDLPGVKVDLALACDASGNGVYRTEYRVGGRDGITRWVRANGAVTFKDGVPARLVGTARDITEPKAAEIALRSRLDEIEALYANTPIGLAMFDLDLRFIRINKLLAEINGVAPADHIGRSVWDILPATRGAMEPKFRQVLKTGETTTLEIAYEFPGHPGITRDWIATYYPLYQSGGAIVGVGAVVEETTERKRAENAIATSEVRYRRLFEAANDGVLILNAETGRIIDANPFMLDLLGVTHEDVLGEELWQIGFLGDENASRAAIATLKKEGRIRYENLPLQSKTGASLEVEVVANVYEEGGQSVIQCNVRDISERVRAAEALRESNARLKIALRAANAGAWEVVPELGMLHASDEFLALFGLEPATVLPLDTAWALVVPDDREKVQIALRQTGETGTPFRVEFRAPAPDGSIRWLLAQAELQKDGTNARIFGLTQDITEQKRREEHLQFLMHEVNHRSKNLLTVVMSIARQMGGPENRDFVKGLGDRIEGLALSHDLLAHNEWKSIDLENLVRAQLIHLKSLFETRITICGEVVKLSAASAQTIGLALHELATNATKYGAMSDDKGMVAISWTVTGTAGEPDRRFAFSWRESGGPQVSPPARRGFGSTVTVAMVQASFDGDVSAEYAQSGFVWQLDCPAENVIEE